MGPFENKDMFSRPPPPIGIGVPVPELEQPKPEQPKVEPPKLDQPKFEQLKFDKPPPQLPVFGRGTARQSRGCYKPSRRRSPRRRHGNDRYSDEDDLPEACYAVSADQEELGYDREKGKKDPVVEENPYEGPTIFDKVFKTNRVGSDGTEKEDRGGRVERDRDTEMEREWRKYKEKTEARIKREKDKLAKFERKMREIKEGNRPVEDNGGISSEDGEGRTKKQVKRKSRSSEYDSSLPKAYAPRLSNSSTESESDESPTRVAQRGPRTPPSSPPTSPVAVSSTLS